DLIVTGVQTCALPISGRFRVGEYEWCEPDYRQILLWAKALELNADEVMKRLPNGPEQDEGEYWDRSLFCNGRLLRIVWDFDLLRSEERRVGKEWCGRG